MTALEVPTRLPVDHLSVSSLKLYVACPTKWMRRYVLKQYEPTNGPMVLGSSVGAALALADHDQIDTGTRPPAEQIEDLFADEWEDRTTREEIVWRDDKPGTMKDNGIAAVRLYEQTIGPTLKPISVEREFTLTFAGMDWNVTGFIDLELEDGTVADRKVKGRKLSQDEADSDLQPPTYMLARRAEGNPASGFEFHTMITTKTPQALVVPTRRTDAQLDALTDRILKIAAEINWRMETDVWAGAVPGSWQCSSRYCGYWQSCPMGGAR